MVGRKATPHVRTAPRTGIHPRIYRLTARCFFGLALVRCLVSLVATGIISGPRLFRALSERLRSALI